MCTRDSYGLFKFISSEVSQGQWTASTPCNPVFKENNKIFKVSLSYEATFALELSQTTFAS